MKSVNVYFMSLLIGSIALSSCGKNEVVENENEVPEGIDNIVSFQAQLNAPSRATDT